MRRLVMQLMRTGITIIIVGTMAAMIFSLRDDLASARAKLARVTIETDDPGLFATLQTRTSVRKFDPARDVDAATVEKLLRAGMSAPSAMNKQPWSFFVVRDAQKRARLAELLPYSRIGNGAPLALVVCGNLDNGLPGRGKEYWIQDCSAASMNVLLAAKALGLGAVWTGVYPGEERIAAVRQVLGIPEAYMPLNIIPIGYPAESPTPKDKWDARKVHYDVW